jgi:glucokinase
MESSKLAIGLDIGGTKMKAGLVDAEGNVVGTPLTEPTLASQPGEEIIGRLLKMLNKLREQAAGSEIVGIGVGCTGPLDLATGSIADCNTLPTLHNYPLKQTIEDACRLGVELNNDANAMILGEARWGAGRGRDTVLGVTLGTGLGCAYVQHLRILDGATGNAGEMWLSPYRESTIEEYASGTGLGLIYQRIAGRQASGAEIARLAAVGDADALRAFDEMGDALTFALSWMINLFDPDAVVVGGSVANSAPLFLPRVETNLRRFVTQQAYQHLTLRCAQLGDNAGFIGAAALVL